jgi:DNA-binding MarR family transcriptional regulator/GNAT superfamily N-acetyltransferase
MDKAIESVRRFNRFYTRQIGVLNEGLLNSPFSLTEVRVLYELAHREQATARVLGQELGLDPGYLSRILHAFEKKRFIERKPSAEDGRQVVLSLTRQGRNAFAPLEKRQNDEVAAMLGRLQPDEQQRLTAAMGSIERLLGSKPESTEPYVIRPHQAGDMGWIIHRHGVLYTHEYGWDDTFEALVAQIASEFILNFDPKRERCWIAERDGQIVGSIFLVKKSETVSKLRLLYVEPSARGLGIGKRLVTECVRFARQAGYKKVTLWTQSNLLPARHLYQLAGFKLVAEEKNHSFGHDLISETWELKL